MTPKSSVKELYNRRGLDENPRKMHDFARDIQLINDPRFSLNRNDRGAPVRVVVHCCTTKIRTSICLVGKHCYMQVIYLPSRLTKDIKGCGVEITESQRRWLTWLCRNTASLRGGCLYLPSPTQVQASRISMISVGFFCHFHSQTKSCLQAFFIFNQKGEVSFVVRRPCLFVSNSRHQVLISRLYRTDFK